MTPELFSHAGGSGMQTPSEDEAFQSVGPLCPFRLFVLNHPLFRLLALLPFFFFAKTPWRDTTWENVVHQTFLFFFFTQTCNNSTYGMCCCVHLRRLLTCSVALHLNDTFGLLARLPGVEGPHSNGDFYGRPRHVCCSGLFPPVKIACISPPKRKHKMCVISFYQKDFFNAIPAKLLNRYFSTPVISRSNRQQQIWLNKASVALMFCK